MNNMLAKNARRFKVTLTICLVLAVITASSLVFLAVQFTSRFADDVSKKVYEADNSQAKVSTIKNLSSQLDKQKSTVQNVNRIVADTVSYQYQDVIVGDLNKMASLAGVKITNLDFAEDSKTTTKAPVKKIAGLNYKTVDISLHNPVNYNNFLNFIHFIERNNTKMQILNLSISGPDLANKGVSKTDINSNSLTVEVYVR